MKDKAKARERKKKIGEEEDNNDEVYDVPGTPLEVEGQETEEQTNAPEASQFELRPCTQTLVPPVTPIHI